MFTLEADPALIVHGIVATVDAIVELLQVQPRRPGDARQPAARVAINVQSMKVRPALIVDVNCPALAISARQADHFFENRDEECTARFRPPAFSSPPRPTWRGPTAAARTSTGTAPAESRSNSSTRSRWATLASPDARLRQRAPFTRIIAAIYAAG